MKHWIVDSLVLGGLLLIGVGCWQIAPWLAFVTIGTLLLTGGLAAHFKGAGK